MAISSNNIQVYIGLIAVFCLFSCERELSHTLPADQHDFDRVLQDQRNKQS